MDRRAARNARDPRAIGLRGDAGHSGRAAQRQPILRVRRDSSERVLAARGLADFHAAPQQRSLVLRLRYGDSSALLEGDAERVVEQRMSALHELKSDLLKVGHHGSASSSSPEFIQAVRPRWAVISVGARNTFGHPRIETLQRLEKEGAATYRTDLDGAVTFYLDGHSVSPALACLR